MYSPDARNVSIHARISCRVFKIYAIIFGHNYTFSMQLNRMRTMQANGTHEPDANKKKIGRTRSSALCSNYISVRRNCEQIAAHSTHSLALAGYFIKRTQVFRNVLFKQTGAMRLWAPGNVTKAALYSTWPWPTVSQFSIKRTSLHSHATNSRSSSSSAEARPISRRGAAAQSAH